MSARATMIVLPGDSIGPEIMRESLRVIDWFGTRRGFDCTVRVEPYGAAAYRKTGVWLAEGVLADMLQAGAVMLGSVGSGPDFERIPAEIRRRWGMLRLRRELALHANLRPIKACAAVADASPLRPDVTRGVDILFVRELAGGIYQQAPRGIDVLPDGQRRGLNTQVYTTSEIHRIARVAFELARTRHGKVASIDKANAMESGQLWREEVQALRDAEYKDIELRHVYVDNAAFELIHNPRSFDLVLADNMFGDILSDGAAVIAGSPSMLPSASLGEPRANGRQAALYEPLHSDASSIAGRNTANPIGAILCVALAFEITFGRREDARLLHAAVDAALATGARTADIATGDQRATSTSAMGAAVVSALDRLAEEFPLSNAAPNQGDVHQ